jgi:hypothetical protein
LTEFHHVVRIWRHLLMLKRSGRGHDPEGATATLQGELAIECPACPHPDRNLPDNWDAEGPQQYVMCCNFCKTSTDPVPAIDIYTRNFLQLMVISSCVSRIVESQIQN